MSDTLLRCPDCHGAGEVEFGKRRNCGCPYHQGSGECFCLCEHYNVECRFCGGMGVLIADDEARGGAA